jgi:intergrase/recombinase
LTTQNFFINAAKPNKPKATPIPKSYDRFAVAREKTGIRVTPQILRERFCSEMGRLGVPDRYVDAFCGRVPASVLAKHYTDFSPEKLQEIYERAGLKVLS